jgi:hypothetical protein
MLLLGRELPGVTGRLYFQVFSLEFVSWGLGFKASNSTNKTVFNGFAFDRI